jgi:hypothetical protein
MPDFDDGIPGPFVIRKRGSSRSPRPTTDGWQLGDPTGECEDRRKKGKESVELGSAAPGPGEYGCVLRWLAGSRRYARFAPESDRTPRRPVQVSRSGSPGTQWNV